MNAGLMPGSSKKKFTAQTPISATSMNGNRPAISKRCDDRVRQPNESAIPSATASPIWIVTPKATGFAGSSALTLAAVVTPRANVAGSAPFTAAYSVTHAISAKPPAAPATIPWRVVSSSDLARLLVSCGNEFRIFPLCQLIMSCSLSMLQGGLRLRLPACSAQGRAKAPASPLVSTHSRQKSVQY